MHADSMYAPAARVLPKITRCRLYTYFGSIWGTYEPCTGSSSQRWQADIAAVSAMIDWLGARKPIEIILLMVVVTVIGAAIVEYAIAPILAWLLPMLP